MPARELSIDGAFEFVPKVFSDERGLFVCPFISAEFEDALGYQLPVAQTNNSVSARGVLRGLHFADVPPSQSKYVYCSQGSGLDVIVDLRVGSPTFGRHEVIRLDATEYRATFLSEGLGHAFFALEDNTVLTYLCSTGYNPGGEHGLNPLDAELAVAWPAEIAPILSAKDEQAPTLAEALEKGMLPDYEQCQQLYARNRS